MPRNQLSALIRKTAEKLGYHFYEGFEYRMNECALKFPAVWLSPPKTSRVEGRRERKITYRVVLHLMQCNRKFDESAKNRVWDGLERDALRLTDRLTPQQNVFCTENISMAPAEFTLTRQGELSLRVEFDVRTDDCQTSTDESL